MIHASQKHWGFAAALLHRLSGLALAVFLPLHFLALGLALEGKARFDSFLSWADHPLVKASEFALLAALTLHLALGLRVLVLEFLPWRGARTAYVPGALLLALAAGLGFLAVLR